MDGPADGGVRLGPVALVVVVGVGQDRAGLVELGESGVEGCAGGRRIGATPVDGQQPEVERQDGKRDRGEASSGRMQHERYSWKRAAPANVRCARYLNAAC